MFSRRLIVALTVLVLLAVLVVLFVPLFTVGKRTWNVRR